VYDRIYVKEWFRKERIKHLFGDSYSSLIQSLLKTCGITLAV
jgi:hypothetical protein